MNRLQTQVKQQTQEQELIPQELVEKFDNDKQLVQEFMEQGYTVKELQASTILHATKYDPLVILENGFTAGMWLDSPQEQNKYRNSSRTYQNRFSS